MAGAGIAAFVWGNVQVAAVFMIADLVLMGLLFANTEDKINLQVHNLFDDNVQVNEYMEKMKTDSAFAQAVSYVYHLSPTDHLKFGRLISELRYEADQKVLAQFARIFRKEQP
jgi:hypothetical protein